jgi:hypothetical protein
MVELFRIPLIGGRLILEEIFLNCLDLSSHKAKICVGEVLTGFVVDVYVA